mgnify:CR=1 FL=1
MTATFTRPAPQPATEVPTVDEIVSRLAPVLRSTSAESESARKLAPAAMAALIDARVPRALIPARYGGLELGPVEGVRLFEELAAVESSAAWVGMLAAAAGWLCGLLPQQGAEELLADPRSVINGSLFPPMVAEQVAGGYRVHGRTSFGSGCQHATWLQFQAVIMDGAAPRMAPNGMPAAVMVHVPAASARIIENWDTLGMRGTGSHDFEVSEMFVPDHLCWAMGPVVTANPAWTDGLGRMGMWWFSAMVASVALGAARAAVADAVELAGAKTPNYSHTLLADRSQVQDKLARARAQVDAARAYLYATLASTDRAVANGDKLSIEDGIPLALAGSNAVEAACSAVDLVHRCIGTTGIRSAEPFQRYFRDVHTISQHAFASPARFESIGKLMLGRESDWPFYYL